MLVVTRNTANKIVTGNPL